MSMGAQAKMMGTMMQMQDENSKVFKDMMAKLKGMFDGCDKDKDGLLNQAEFMEFKKCE